MKFIKKNWLTIALGVIILVLLFWNVNQNDLVDSYRLEKERDKARLEKRDKQIRQLFDSLAKQDLEALKWLQAEKMRADRAEEKLTIANEKLNSIRFVRFSNDSVRSGAISDLYPSYRPR